MRKTKILAILSAVALVFSACSSEETTTLTEKSPQLLKSFKVKKDALGKYYLDYDLKDDAKIDKIYDASTSTNQIYLYSSDVATERKLSEEFGLTDSKLRIGFVDTNSDKSPSITITDDNISLAKGSAEELVSYEIAGNEDGTYQLDFTVASNVNVDFVYNDEIDAYEIHLQEGKVNETSFSRTFEKENGKSLKIDFVNHFDTVAAKGEYLEAPRKPRVIIDDGND